MRSHPTELFCLRVMSRSPWDSISRSSQRSLLHNLGSPRTVFDPAPAARGVFLGITLFCPHTKDKFPDHGSTGQRPSPSHKLQIYVGSFGSGRATKATAIWKVFNYVITEWYILHFCHLTLHLVILDAFFSLSSFGMFRPFQERQFQTFCQGFLWNLGDFPKLFLIWFPWLFHSFCPSLSPPIAQPFFV